MSSLMIRSARVAPGKDLQDIRCVNGLICEIGSELEASDSSTFDAAGRVVVPGFVDCHTHACWAGSRLDEWEQGLRGVSYLELLQQGGGIMATVRAVRQASEHNLAAQLLARLMTCLRHGTTTIEVKSGYGLNTESELKMLRAIEQAAEQWPGTVVPTACIGHAKDPDAIDQVRRTIEETLPAITSEFPGVTIDAYCEQGAWTLSESLSLFDASMESGHPVRVHADQFNDFGLIPEAIRREFRSVDHLEATNPEHLEQLAQSSTYGVMLPMCGWHLDDRYADGRMFLDAGGSLAIASNLNPGSAPCPSLAAVQAQAVRKLGLTAGEALKAATRTAAELLGFADRGCIEVGARADLVLLDAYDHRDISFYGGWNPVVHTWIAGQSV